MILGHWEVRGAAQPIRNLLHYLGFAFKEIKYPDENSWFNEAKAKLKSDFPNLPYLIDEEKTLTETDAILIYIALKAKRTDLLGKNLDGEIYLVQVRSFWADIRTKIYEIAFDKNDKAIEKSFKEKVVPGLRLLSKHLGKQNFICGYLTVMDFVIVEGLEWLSIQEGDLLEGMDNLKGLIQRVYELPGVKEYQESKDIPKYFLWEGYANKNLKICY